jgi:hypothetical protein
MIDPDYHLVLRPLPCAVPAVVRVRKALKTLLRAFGLKCVRIEEKLAEGPNCGGNQHAGGTGGPVDG